MALWNAGQAGHTLIRLVFTQQGSFPQLVKQGPPHRCLDNQVLALLAVLEQGALVADGKYVLTPFQAALDPLPELGLIDQLFHLPGSL
jgi:hypothetical protein